MRDIQQSYLSVEASVRFRLYRTYLQQWVALWRRRERLHRGLLATVGAAVACKKAVTAEAFTALRTAAVVAKSGQQR